MNTLQTVHTTDIVNTIGGEELINRFLANIDTKPKTKDTYRKALKQFNSFITENGITQTERAHILQYKAFLTANYSASTVSAYLTAVKQFYKWLEAEKIYPNITAGIKGAKQSKGHKKDTLTIDQAKELLQSFEKKTIEQLRDFAIINLLIRTGLRTIEIERANIEDIRQEAGQSLLYIQGKGRDTKDDFVKLTPATLKPIQAYLIARGETDGKKPLFASESNRTKGDRLTTRSIRRIVKESLRSIGIDSEKITAHSLRHTAVTFSLLGGATIQEAQAMARHSNINTTLIYAHNIDRIQNGAENKIDSFLSA